MCVSSCVGQNLYHKLPPMNITSQLCHPSSVEWFCLTSSKSHVAWQSLGTSRSSPPWCSPVKAGGILTVKKSTPVSPVMVYGGFLKWWYKYPATIGLPTQNDHFGVFWGYHHLRKRPYKHLFQKKTLDIYPSIFHNAIQRSHGGNEWWASDEQKRCGTQNCYRLKKSPEHGDIVDASEIPNNHLLDGAKTL